jgi:hypothetical protein
MVQPTTKSAEAEATQTPEATIAARERRVITDMEMAPKGNVGINAAKGTQRVQKPNPPHGGSKQLLLITSR